MIERYQHPSDEWPVPVIVHQWLHQLALLVDLDQHLKRGEGQDVDVAFTPQFGGQHVVFELPKAQQGVRRGVVARFEDLEAAGYANHARQVIWSRLGKQR
jgi:hypothetical protein